MTPEVKCFAVDFSSSLSFPIYQGGKARSGARVGAQGELAGLMVGLLASERL